MWALDCGGHTWAFPEASTMPAVADPIRMTIGDVRLLTGDFGNLKELQGADLTAGSVSVAPSGVTAANVQRGLYWVSAWFTATSAGEYVVTFTGELADGTVLKRKAALVVE